MMISAHEYVVTRWTSLSSLKNNNEYHFEDIQSKLIEAGFYKDSLFTTLFLRFCSERTKGHYYILTTTKFNINNVEKAVKEYRKLKFKRKRKEQKFDDYVLIEELTSEKKIENAINLLKENGYRIFIEEINLKEI